MSHSRVRTTKIGKLGEKQFDDLATQADYTVNKSGEDEAGWDFHLEPIPSRERTTDTDEPGHTDTFEFKARVQVKSTDSRAGKVDVKLSNWLRLVEDPNPAFFAIAGFDGADTIQRLFLVSVDERAIRAALKRRRENAVGDNCALNELTMQVTYGPEHQVPDLAGSTIDRHLRSVLDSFDGSLNTYYRWKADLVSRSGFEGGNALIQASLPPGYSHDQLEAELSSVEVGLMPHIVMRDVKVFASRFGIPNQRPLETLGTSRFSVVRDPDQDSIVKVEVTVEDTRIRTTFLARAAIPSALGMAMREGRSLAPHRIRVYAHHFEAVFAMGGNRNATLKTTDPPYEQRFTNVQIRQRLKLTSLFASAAEAQQEVTVALTFDPNETKPQIRFRGLVPNPPEIIANIKGAARTMKRYLDLCHRFQVADEAQVSHAELDEQHHFLAEFEGYTDDHFGLDDMTFGVQPLPEFTEMLEESVGKRAAVVSPWSLRLGSHTFTQAIGMCGPLELLHISGDGTFRLRVVGDTVVRLDRFAQNGLPDEETLWAFLEQSRAKTWVEGHVEQHLALSPHVMGETLMIAE